MTGPGVRGILTVLVAPDSFKGSLTSIEVARGLAAGWLAARPGDEVLLAPLADGGEGTLAAINAAGGWVASVADAHDPIGRSIRVEWLRSADGTRAVVELAAASGLSRLAAGERNAAAATYGPQKGASPGDVRRLDAELEGYASALEAATGRRERDRPGAGAAGGTGFGLLCVRDRFRSLDLRPGVDLVMEAVGFDERLARADIVLTGEGRIDAQTAFGKTALGVAVRAHGARVACVAFGGGVESQGAAALAELGAIAIPVAEGPSSLEALIAAGVAPLERAAERVARLLSLGTAIRGAG